MGTWPAKEEREAYRHASFASLLQVAEAWVDRADLVRAIPLWVYRLSEAWAWLQRAAARVALAYSLLRLASSQAMSSAGLASFWGQAAVPVRVYSAEDPWREEALVCCFEPQAAPVLVSPQAASHSHWSLRSSSAVVLGLAVFSRKLDNVRSHRCVALERSGLAYTLDT